MKIILIMVAVSLLSIGPMAMAVEDRLGDAASEAKKDAVPCACVCPETLPSTKWSCSPTACSAKDGGICAAGGPSQSPIGAQTPAH